MNTTKIEVYQLSHYVWITILKRREKKGKGREGRERKERGMKG